MAYISLRAPISSIVEAAVEAAPAADAAPCRAAAAASMPAAASPRRLRLWRTKAILVCVLEAAIARERLYHTSLPR